MSKNWVNSILNDVKNTLRVNRNNAATIVWDNPEIFSDLIKMAFDVTNKQSIKAAWVMEWVCTHKSLDIILPYLDFFTSSISKVTFDSAKRPCAKICEHLAIAYTNKQQNLTQETLTKTHITNIVETGFDWLIQPEKIAVKAYTMQTLYLFGLHVDWIHPELEHIIRTDVIHQSKACEARGKKILQLIAKNKPVL